MSSRVSKKLLVAISFSVICIATWLAYSDINNHEFLDWDDHDYILSNEFIRSLSLANILWMFTHFDSANWHPITWLSYALNFHLWDDNPFAFKLTNIILHLCNSFLVFLLARKLFAIYLFKLRNSPATTPETISSRHLIIPSLLAAGLFAVHPQHVESVVWISDRKDLLCTLFFLSGIITYLEQHESNHKSLWTNITITLFVLALMSKSLAVTFPAVLVLIDFFVLRRINFSRNFRQMVHILFIEKITYIALSSLVIAITLITQNSQIISLENSSFPSRIINASLGLLHYLSTIIYPSGLSPYYPFHQYVTAPTLLSFIPVGLVLALLYMSIYLYQKNKPYVLIALLFFVVTISPVIGIVQIGHAAAADRYAYLPTTGIYILLACSFYYWIVFLPNKFPQNIFSQSNLQGKNWPIAAASTAVIIILTLLASQTFGYTKIWKNDETLWTHVIETYPNGVATAHINLGRVYYKNKEYIKAIDEYQKAAAIDPLNYGPLQNIAMCYERLGERQLALEYYLKMVAGKPDTPNPYYIIGDYFYKKSNYAKAEFYYNEAIRIAPTSNGSLLRSAMMNFIKGQYASASQKLDYLLKLSPEDIGGMQLRAKIYLRDDNLQQAQELAKKILTLRPNDNLAKQILNKSDENAQL